MKKIICIVLFPFALLAQNNGVQYTRSTDNTSLEWSTTNTFYADVTKSTAVNIDVSLTGAAARITTAAIGVTNVANATNGQTLSITVAGVTNIYTWTNSPQTQLATPGGYGTNLVIGISDATALTNTTLIIASGPTTNIFTWSATPTAATDIQSNNVAEVAATNLFRILSGFYSVVSVSANTVTVQFLPGAYPRSYSPNWGTNYISGYATLTNTITTNFYHLQVTNSAAYSTTNLYNKLSTDYAGVLTLAYTSPTNISVTTLYNPGLSATRSASWGSLTITTNALAGEIFFKGYSSSDKLTWYRAATKDFTVAFLSTSQTNYTTNFTSLGPIGYYKWVAENAATNYARANDFKFTTSTKDGL